jgi:prephenate dehydrogenase
MKPIAECRITVVGLGLMGGSLAGALRGKCEGIVGVAHRMKTLNRALTDGLIDTGTTDLAAGVDRADVVVLATPVRVIMRQLAEIGSMLAQECLLMDLGSTKAQIVAAMEGLPDNVQPVGGHPMCGREVSGIGAVDPTLYQGCTFILTPLSRTSQEALGLAEELVEAVGAHPLELAPERQDFLVATLSHLPYLLACALVSTADTTISADPATWEIIAGGFRDTARVAGSDVTMMLDILLSNKEEILRALATYQTTLSGLAQLVKSGDESVIRPVLRTIREKREEMYT